MMESRYAEYVARSGDRYSEAAEASQEPLEAIISSCSDVRIDPVEQILMEEEGLQHAVNHLLNSTFRAAPALAHRWHLRDELLNSYHDDVDAAVNHLMKLFSLGWSEDSAKGKKTHRHIHTHTKAIQKPMSALGCILAFSIS